MASKKAGKLIPKLHAVTLIKSGIGRPWWQKETLKVLQLTKLHKTVIHKNTPSVNGQLLSVKELINVKPVVLRTDIKNSPTGGEFYLDNGEFFINPSEWYEGIDGRKMNRRDRLCLKNKEDSIKKKSPVAS